MECKKIQELLGNISMNDLSKSDRELIERHISICSECESKWQAYGRAEILQHKLRKTLPVDPNRAAHIQAINSLIATNINLKASKTEKERILLYKRLSTFINLAAAFLIGLFVYQQIEIKNSLKHLENQLKQEQEVNTMSTIPNLATDYSQPGNLPAVHKDVVKELDAMQKSENSLLIKYLKSKHPEVYEEYRQHRKIEEQQTEL